MLLGKVRHELSVYPPYPYSILFFDFCVMMLQGGGIPDSDSGSGICRSAISRGEGWRGDQEINVADTNY